MSAQERLKAAVTQLQSFSDELDKKDALSGEDIAALKARMEDVKSLREQVEAEAEAKGEAEEARKFLKSLTPEPDVKDVQPVKLSTDWGAPMATNGQTFGEMFVKSDAYGDFMKQYANSAGIIPASTKGIRSKGFQPDVKTLVTGTSSTSGGAFVVNDRYGAVTDLIGDRELTIADLVTQGSTTSDTVEYVRVTGKTNNAAQVAEATTAAAGAISGATPGPYVVATPSGTKPESALALEVVSTLVKTTAHWLPITKRAASDAGQIRTLIDNFLMTGLDEKLEDGILKGDGTGETFLGILSSSPQTVGSAGTDLDAIVAGIAAVRTVGRRRPNGLVVHPNDWYSTGFLLAKDSQLNYLVGDPRASIDQLNTLWGLRVVVTEAMTENTALVGDFKQAVLWKREGASILVSDQHADYFVRNLLAILAERRDAFGVLDSEAFCTVTAV